MNEHKTIWFRAKKYGWGWGLPCAWQGWVVLILYVIAAAVGGVILAPRLGLFIPYMIGIVAVFTTIAWLKGEKPGWRWGDKR